MAELLIKAVDAIGTPEQEPGLYKRGDLVCVQEDGWLWGDMELFPPKNGGKFVVIKIPGISVEQIKSLIHSRWSGLLPDDSERETGTRERKMLRRRLLQVTLDSFPAPVRNQLINTGTYTTSIPEIRNFIRHKVRDEVL